jgi:hypothetical protein
MLQLVDGPCKGSFMVKRAPFFLRAVIKRELDGAGETDVLDQPEDTPGADESVFVYQRFGATGWVHIDGKGIHGTYVIAQYKLMPEVDGSMLRDNAAWQAWATARLAQLEKQEAKEAKDGAEDKAPS